MRLSSGSKYFYPFLFLLVLSLPLLTVRLDSYPPVWFDEGYRTNQARTLVERGVYGTHTVEGDYPFNPATTGGPADILAVALSFKIFGIGIAQGRWAVVVLAIVALFGLYALAAHLFGRRAGLFITLFVLAVPAIQNLSLLLLGRQVMSEVPALAWIVLGLTLWFWDWERGGWLTAAAAGTAVGFGLLSKTQTAIYLAPSLFIIATLRSWADRSRVIKYFAPVTTMAGVMVAWKIVEWLGTPESLRQRSAAEIAVSVQTLLVTSLFGSVLTRTAFAIFVIMVVVGTATLWRLWRAKPLTHARWGEATLAVIALASAGWFAFISIGWLRYAFVGWVLSLLLAGKWLWDGLDWLGRRWPKFAARGYGLAVVGLAVSALIAHGYPILLAEAPTPAPAQKVADYIRTRIPAGAVIETWEWEIDALSGHWAYHHPDDSYMLLAIRQKFYYGNESLDLNYNLLEADPDYLITGTFSEWTNIYGGPDAVKAHFTEVVTISPYRIYQRAR